MHIILTHEQADFDALASLLGAFLINENAVPVLPRRMNRNVRAFLSLYGAELPFVDPRDLPNKAIERITLVDTQAMVSLKGVIAEPSVDVIDHHPPRETLQDKWNLMIQDVGATTTIIVEELLEHNEPISPVHATLMLMGIYEDTGSLTYSRTNGRDLRAAATLIDQGASLSIANDFLNHPLSQAQQALYDRLRSKAEYLTIHGYKIVIATGHALEMEEELSSIAHKLRDLLDPDAIILLVTTRSGIQLIARSTTDNIDVSALAANFGGGGHERASAGLIRGRDLESIHAELVDLLPRHIIPAVTVAQIMSSGPQVLSPETSVQEAARRMRRYGYEGYPVVQNGKVVGLLTRRAVDRATAHKLDFSVGRLMEKGDHCVSPGDSIEQLQKLVIETGWGQVPVVDPTSAEVIGIVTRTDLLKNLASGQAVPGKLNLATKLESVLPADRLTLLHAIAEIAREQHAALFVVGGFVRDLLLEKPSLDFDLVVEGDAIGLAQALSERYGGRVTGHSRFGTAKWHMDYAGERNRPCSIAVAGLQSVDLVSARTEFYTHPTALPTVERSSIKLDLHRRDFTMNTLALRIDGRHYGELHDYWGGLNDLHAGLVRVLHSLSFVDDPTRILRAVRFEQRFAFSIEDRTMELLLEAKQLIDRLSGDRIRNELNHILVSDFAPQILSRLNTLGLIEAIHPDLNWDDWIYGRIELLENLQPEPEWDLTKEHNQLKPKLGYILWMIRLPLQRVENLTKRLKLPVQLALIIQSACRIWQDRQVLQAAAPGQVFHILETSPPLARYACFLAASDPGLRSALWNHASKWRFVQPNIDGHFLRGRGLPPGPIYRRILDELRDAWLEGRVGNPEEELLYLDNLLVKIRE